MKKPSRTRQSNLRMTRRRSERLCIELPISVRAVAHAAIRQEKTTSVNLSRVGMSFKSTQNYRLRMKLRVSFLETQAILGKSIEVPAQVVRVIRDRAAKGWTVGVRFEDARLADWLLAELLRSKVSVSSALLGIIQALSPDAQIGEVTESICQTTAKAMEAERALLFLRDRDETDVLRAQFRGPERLGEFRARLRRGLLGQAAAAGETVKVADVRADPRFRPALERYFDKRTRSVLCTPLPHEGGRSPGVLVVLNKRYRPFSGEDENLASAVARQTAAVLREARLFEAVRNIKNYNEGILQSIAAGVMTFSTSGNLVTINRAGVQLFGIQPRSDAGKHYTSLFNWASNSRFCTLLEDVLAKQQRRSMYDVQFVRADGANFSLNLSALPLQGAKHGLQGVVLVSEDITLEQRLTNTLCRYVSREVAEKVVQDKDKLKLGGTRAEVTILVADIRNFTSISEQLDPEDVVNLLNTYYPRMINVIFRHQGMVDKFIGDAILAVFGVPVRRPDDALRAARAALEIRKHVAAISRERARKQLLAVEIGIGISSGAVISGNIGSERRMDYTVIGDPVNLAARLEGLTKELERKILVTEPVWAAIEKEIPCDALGSFKVRGKLEEVPVFAVKNTG